MRPVGAAFHARLPAISGNSAAPLSTEAPHRACSGVATQSSAVPPRDRTGVWFLGSESLHTGLPRFDACEPRGLAAPTRSRSVEDSTSLRSLGESCARKSWVSLLHMPGSTGMYL